MSFYSIYESLALQVTTKRATYVVNYPCHSMILREDIQKKKNSRGVGGSGEGCLFGWKDKTKEYYYCVIVRKIGI